MGYRLQFSVRLGSSTIEVRIIISRLSLKLFRLLPVNRGYANLSERMSLFVDPYDWRF